MTGAQPYANEELCRGTWTGKEENTNGNSAAIFPQYAGTDKQRGRKWLSNSYNLKQNENKAECMRMCITTDIKYISVLLWRAD